MSTRIYGPHPCRDCGTLITHTRAICTACWHDPAISLVRPDTPYRTVEDLRECPKCGDRFLRVLEHEVGVLCTLGHSTFVREGQWDREAARPRPVPPIDGISMPVRVRSPRRRGVGKALTITPGWRSRTSISVKTG